MIAMRYTLLEQIGIGGTGIVHRAQDRLTGKLVALKQVHPLRRPYNYKNQDTPTTRHPQALALTVEFRTMASLQHPHINTVQDYGFHDNRPYLTMDLIENSQTIVEYGKKLDFAGKVGLLLQMLQALAYLHRRNIVHRDLKPSNVLVTEDGVVKVMDFGMAVYRHSSATPTHHELAGTLEYMSPEVIQHNQATIQSDLFAVGIIAYELFAGDYPFNRDNPALLIYNIVEDPPDLQKLDARVVGFVATLLAKHPLNRYANASAAIEALCDATDRELPLETLDVRDSYLKASEFVGREAELNTLLDSLDDILSETPRGHAWLVGGESGVGKSRLIDELRIRANIAGALVLRGQGVSETPLSYVFWREPVRRLLLTTAVSDVDAGILKELVPDVDHLLGREIPTVPVLERNEGQQRLINTIVRLFERQPNPMVLLLEDLQWAKESLNPLQKLLSILERIPILVVGSYRDDERKDLPQVLPKMQVMKLRRLSQDEITTLSTSMLGDIGADPHLVDYLQRETEGNAFFMVEVIRTLASDAGKMSHIGRLTLPQHLIAGGMEEVVRRRLGQMPHWGQTLLKCAAVYGRLLHVPILEKAIELYPDLLSDHPLSDWLTVGANAAVLEMVDGEWRFNHDKLRNALQKDLQPHEAEYYHRVIAEAIEAYDPHTDQWAAVLLEHWRNANNRSKQIQYAIITCEQMLNVGNYDLVVDKIAETLMLVDDTDLQRRADLLDRKGSALYSIGAYDESIACFEQCLLLGQQMASTRHMVSAYTGLAHLHLVRGDSDTALEFFGMALEKARESDDEYAIGRVLWRHGLCYRVKGEYEKAEQYYSDSLVLALKHQNIVEQRIIHSGMGLLFNDQDKWAQASEHYEKAHAISTRIGDRHGTLLVVTGLGWAAYKQGRYDYAMTCTQESLAIAREINSRWMIANALGNLGKIQLEIADHAGAVYNLREAIKIAHAIDAPPLLLEILPGFARILIHEGQYEYATRLAALALYHPASYNEIALQARPLLADLATMLEESIFNQQVKEGQALDLDTVAHWIVTQHTTP